MDKQVYHSYVGGKIFDLNEFPIDNTNPPGRWVRNEIGGEPFPAILWHQIFNTQEYYVAVNLTPNNPPLIDDIGFIEDDLEVQEIPEEVAIDSLRALGFFPTKVTSIWPIALVLGLVGIVMLGKFK